MLEEIALVTDSSACVPTGARDRLGIIVVPILVSIGGEEFRDGVDLDPGRLYRALERGLPVKSAAPSPLDYIEAIERTGVANVIVITPATEFTRMFRNASLGAELSERRVTVIDSRSATAGHGLVILAAARARAEGGGFDDVVAVAEDAAARVDLAACLESLSFLRQSGRVPAMALGLADHLGVRPVFRMRQGTAERIGLPRSERAALARIVREWRESGGAGAEHVAVFHAGRPERADELAGMLGKAAWVTEFSAAMAIHTGPGVVGAAWLRPAAEGPGQALG
jgi:DegV family protein with EDD domain